MNHTTAPTCPWCGCLHPNTMCPKARAIDYYQDGTVKRVEFWESPKITQTFVNLDDVLKNLPK